jgi:hypothetical protein
VNTGSARGSKRLTVLGVQKSALIDHDEKKIYIVRLVYDKKKYPKKAVCKNTKKSMKGIRKRPSRGREKKREGADMKVWQG